MVSDSWISSPNRDSPRAPGPSAHLRRLLMSSATERMGRIRRTSRNPLPLDDRQIAESVQRLKLVADETRLRILSTLSEGDRNVTALCDALNQSQPAVS